MLSYENGWTDIDNPIAVFKWVLVASMLVFILVATYKFTTFDRKKAAAFADRMEAKIDSGVVMRLRQQRDQIANKMKRQKAFW